MFRAMTILAVAGSLALAGCAGQSTRTEARSCFPASSVRGFTSIDDSTVHLQVGMRDVYELKLLGYCPDVDWSNQVGLRTRSGSSMICVNDPTNIELLIPDGVRTIGMDRCQVRSVRVLDPDELAALGGKTSKKPADD